MKFSFACLLWVAFALASCSRPITHPAEKPEAKPARAITLQLPLQGAYTGAYLDFGETEDDVTVEAIEDFNKMVGKTQAIVASSSYWGEQTFPRANVERIFHSGAIPLVYWSPWDKPYDQDKPPTRFHLQHIIDGDWDSYIDHWADEAKAFGQPFFVAWGLEMNGTWFPWSGYFYGADKPAPPGSPSPWLGPATYIRAYRHVVDRVRARGVQNILWVFHANNYSYPEDHWNQLTAYYPGSAYVDWLGLSVYGKQFAKNRWVSFYDSVKFPFQQIATLDPTKPVMLAEWGIGEFPKSGDKGAWITAAFDEMKKLGPRFKAAVFWHERWENADGSYSNLRVNSSPGALQAYRRGVADPFWLDHPLYPPHE